MPKDMGFLGEILMKRLIITIAMLLVVALAIGQSAVKKGLSLGGIYIGDSKREVLTKYGQPDEKDCDRWVYDFNKCKFSVEFNDDEVSLLAVHGELDRASSFKTRLGVRLGDKEATLIKAYGKGTLEYDGAATRIRMYPNLMLTLTQQTKSTLWRFTRNKHNRVKSGPIFPVFTKIVYNGYELRKFA